MREYSIGTRLCVVVLLVMLSCASSELRNEPDRAALEAAIEASANGDSELAAILADSAASKCAPGEAGFTCFFATRLYLANQFVTLGDASLAVSQAQSASNATDAYGDAFSQYMARLTLATMAAHAEQLEVAESALQGARSALSEASEQIPAGEREAVETARSMLHGPQARILMLKGEPDAAARSQAELIRALQRVKPGHHNLPVELLNLAEMHQAAGDPASALSALERAASLAAEHGNTDVVNEAQAAIEALSRPQ